MFHDELSFPRHLVTGLQLRLRKGRKLLICEESILLSPLVTHNRRPIVLTARLQLRVRVILNLPRFSSRHRESPTFSAIPCGDDVRKHANVDRVTWRRLRYRWRKCVCVFFFFFVLCDFGTNESHHSRIVCMETLFLLAERFERARLNRSASNESRK